MDRRREAPEPGMPERERGALDVPIGPVAVEPGGKDAQLGAWTPGEPLGLVRTFRAAFTSDAEVGVLSPDATALIVATVHPDGDDALDSARLVTADGHVSWEGTGLTTS